MKKASILSAAIFLLGLGSAMAAGPDQDLYARGRDAVFAENWAEARQALEEMLRRYPASGHADDAHYWLGMALYESRQPEKAYEVLKQMQQRFQDSPWNDDARVLMVRCAEAVLLAAPSAGGSVRPGRGGQGAEASRLAEYQAFLEQSTQDSSSKVQLLAIDSVLVSRPEKAAELLPRLSAGRASRGAADVVLERFFGNETVKVTLEHPSQGFTEGNVAVIVRQGNGVAHLSLSEALEAARSRGGSGRFDAATVAQIREKLLLAERGLVGGGSTSVESSPEGESRSAIVRVVDGEVHYYRNGDETSRIVVLRRQAGFNAANVRVFLEDRAGIREVPLASARSLGPGSGLSEGTVRYLKAALAIIEIDLSRAAEAGE